MILQVSLGKVDILNLGCDLLSAQDYFSSWLGRVLTPWVIVASLLVLSAVHWALVSAHVIRRPWRLFSLSSFVNKGLAVIQVFYASGVATCLEYFHCSSSADGISYLRAEIDVVCTSHEHQKMMPAAVAIFAMYCVLVPVGAAAILGANAHRLYHPEHMHWLRSIYMPFERRSYLWRPLLMTKLSLIASAILIFSNRPTL